MKAANVTPIVREDDLPGALQDELAAVMMKTKYDDLRVSTIVGVLEYLKWNIINRSDS